MPNMQVCFNPNQYQLQQQQHSHTSGPAPMHLVHSPITNILESLAGFWLKLGAADVLLEESTACGSHCQISGLRLTATELHLHLLALLKLV